MYEEAALTKEPRTATPGPGPPPSPRRLRAGALALLALAAAPAAIAVPVPVVSRFDADAQGWRVINLNPPPVASQAATHLPGEGVVGTLDVYSWTAFSAPAAFLGDLGAYAGGSVSFELANDDRDADAERLPTLLLRSGADFLAWLGGVPGPGLTPFSAVLAPSPQWLVGQTPDTRTPAGAADFARILGAVDGLFINADWKTSHQDSARLDNVVLAALPEPAAAALLGAAAFAAFAASVGARRRRDRPHHA